MPRVDSYIGAPGFSRMSTPTVDVSQNGFIKNVDSSSSVPELEEIDFSKLTIRPRNFPDRQKSCDERSLFELGIGLSPHAPSRDNSQFNLDTVFSPGKRSGLNTPISQFGFGLNYDPNPIVAEAWTKLRESLVHFRGQPVGTIAAVDSSSDEKLNYDQVKSLKLLFLVKCDKFSSILIFFLCG